MTNMKRALVAMAILAMAPVSAVHAQAAGQLQVTPANGYYSSGPQGGPFNPGVQVFSMSNTGGTALSYSCSADQPWVTVFITRRL